MFDTFSEIVQCNLGCIIYLRITPELSRHFEQYTPIAAGRIDDQNLTFCLSFLLTLSLEVVCCFVCEAVELLSVEIWRIFVAKIWMHKRRPTCIYGHMMCVCDRGRLNIHGCHQQCLLYVDQLKNHIFEMWLFCYILHSWKIIFSKTVGVGDAHLFVSACIRKLLLSCPIIVCVCFEVIFSIMLTEQVGEIHCVSKMFQVWLAIGLTHIHQFLQFLAHVISRDSKIGCRYNFIKYLAFTYFIMLWSEMTEMTRLPRHCYSVTRALCKHGF